MSAPTSCIPNFPRPSCPPGAGAAIAAAKAAAKSEQQSKEYMQAAQVAAASAEPPYIGANGNWWRGTTDLGMPARGPEGPEGPKGAPGEKGETGAPGVSTEEYYAGLKTRTTIAVVTPEEMAGITSEEPNIYIIKELA